jgi:hypothetical protein
LNVINLDEIKMNEKNYLINNAHFIERKKGLQITKYAIIVTSARSRLPNLTFFVTVPLRGHLDNK